MAEGWTRLSLPTEGSQQPVFIKFSASASGYEIYLTDLGHIWTETLSRREVIKRALTEDTSIDPSEDAEQFQVLLRKIKDSLYGSRGCKVTVNRSSRGNGLKITTIAKLPAPLQPLEWKFSLSKCAQNVFTRNIVLPLLREERAREGQLRDLMDRLKEKDWVLGKLFDKIEAVGLDLGTVFPSAAGVRSAHKGITLAQATKSIKGVAAFEENAWKAEGGGKDQNKIPDKLSLPVADIDIQSQGTASDNWWDRLDAGTSTIKQGTSFSSTKFRQTQDKETSGENDDDDDFQRQETPPRLKQTTRDRSRSDLPADAGESKVQGDAGHSETTSDDEAPARASKASAQFSHRTKSRSKPLGMIGGKKKPKEDRRSRESTASTASGSESPPPTTTKPNVVDSTESDEEGAQSPARQPPVEKTVKPAAESQPKKRRAGGLGVIGGGKKDKDKQPSRDPTPLLGRSQDTSGDEEESRPQEPPKKPKLGGKLGIIGKNAKIQVDRDIKDLPSRTSKAATPTDSDDGSDELDAPPPKASRTTSKPADLPKDETSSSPEPPPPPPKKPPPEPKEEETMSEKANRRREELKRQLEAKSKAPATKKRKF